MVFPASTKALRGLGRLAEGATTPEREKLVKAVRTALLTLFDLKDEEGKPLVKRAYNFGSFASGKPDPSDIDILARVKTPAGYPDDMVVGEPSLMEAKRAINLFKKIEGFTGGKLHITPSFKLNSKNAKGFRQTGIERYSKPSTPYNWKRLLGLGLGIPAAGIAADTEEAEAFPVEPIASAGKKILKAGLSSASKLLQGRKLGEKTIREVRTGPGDWRYIVFNELDDSGQPLYQAATKDYIHWLSRNEGTKDQLQKFADIPEDSRLTQARRSLAMHVREHRPGVTKTAIRDFEIARRRGEKELGADPNALVFVDYGGRYFQMPQQYAELLEKVGDVKIMRGKRDKPGVKR